MDDSESEAAETEPLVRHGTGTVHAGAETTETAAARGRVAGPRSPGVRPLANIRPRLSLVPETNEKSAEEDNEQRSCKGWSEKAAPDSPTPICPIFGVKNYLHQFYEKQDISDPALYEDLPPMEQVFLVKHGDSGCSSSVFRLSLVLGGLLLLLGVVAFVVAAVAARRTVVVGQNGGVSVVDKVASAHNAQVDALLLVGLVAVTLGSSVVAAALISRTFCSRPEEPIYPFRMGQYVLEPPLSPMDAKVPVTERLTQVQPTWGLASYTSVRSLMPLP
ncbi:neurensin-1-like [Procambarus clarkii]|uniref:neurensin-1 n=1 Tax=Procambarus clarkii TaxID=6728 RepID=UPI001E676889|nr:neurensin-1-like [Procambarus clarkii]